MKQVEATAMRPFYSVCYQYKSNPWTLFSCNMFGAGKFGKGRTMQGTDDLALAKRTANRLLTENGICYAQVSESKDCYNHKQVYSVGEFQHGS